MSGPAERDGRIMAFLIRYQAEHGYPPSRREISQALGWLSLSTLWSDLRRLERAKHIQVAPGIARGIRVLPEGATR